VNEESFENWQLVPIYRALHECGKQFVVVGGQACNLWAEIYNLVEFIPYTSADLDCCTRSKQDVAFISEILNAKPRFPKKIQNPTHDIGVIELEIEKGRKLRIQFLRGTYHFGIEAIAERSQSIAIKGSEICVMHPLQCLEDKLYCLNGISQEDRQDLKHLRMSLRFVPLFIRDRLIEGHIDACLKMLQHILSLAKKRLAKQVSKNHGIKIHKALPLDFLSNCGDKKIRRFMEKQLPREMARIQ
jgi:hypothetical protein